MQEKTFDMALGRQRAGAPREEGGHPPVGLAGAETWTCLGAGEGSWAAGSKSARMSTVFL